MDGIISKTANKVKPEIKKAISKTLDIKDKAYGLLIDAGYEINKSLAEKLGVGYDELESKFIATEPVDVDFICKVEFLLDTEIIKVSKNKFTIDDIVKYLAKENINPIMNYDHKRQCYYYDLDSQSKSHMHLYEDAVLRFRYDNEMLLNLNQQSIEDIVFDLCSEFKDNALYGKNYGNSDWFKLCQKTKHTN